MKSTMNIRNDHALSFDLYTWRYTKESRTTSFLLKQCLDDHENIECKSLAHTESRGNSIAALPFDKSLY